jgi:microcystin-dependent protein
MSYPTNPATGDTYVLGTKSWTYDGTNWVNQATFATFGGAGGAVPAGTVIYHAANTPPTDFIKANGAAISRTTYSDLFSAIGTTFGVGDGSTTFNVPDLRGEFPRGWDDSRGIDGGRAFGSAQADELKAHTHNYTDGTNGTNPTGTGAGTNNSFPVVNGRATSETGGAETRPRNIALLACIKF